MSLPEDRRSQIEELRLRVGLPMAAVLPEGERALAGPPVTQQELERFARFLLPKIQAFYQSEEGQRLFEEWINRRNAEEKTGKCKGS